MYVRPIDTIRGLHQDLRKLSGSLAGNVWYWLLPYPTPWRVSQKKTQIMAENTEGIVHFIDTTSTSNISITETTYPADLREAVRLREWGRRMRMLEGKYRENVPGTVQILKGRHSWVVLDGDLFGGSTRMWLLESATYIPKQFIIISWLVLLA